MVSCLWDPRFLLVRRWGGAWVAEMREYACWGVGFDGVDWWLDGFAREARVCGGECWVGGSRGGLDLCVSGEGG